MMELGRETMRAIYVVAFLDLWSVSLVVTVLASYLREELGLSATAAGALGSVYGIVQFFSSPAAGKAADRRGYAQALSTCCLLCAPAYALLGLRSALAVAVARLTAGAFKHTQNLARTLVASCASEHEKVTAYGRLNAIGNLGFMVGPAFASWLMSRFGYNSIFLLVCVVFVVNAYIVHWKFPDVTAGVEKAEAERGCLESLRAIDWSLHWDIMLLRFLMSFTALLYRNGFNWLLKDKFGLGVESVGYLTSYQGTAAFLSSFFASYFIERYAERSTALAHSVLILVIAYIGLLSSAFLSAYTAFLLVFVVATSLLRVLVLDVSLARCSKSERGLMVGASASVVSVARAVSPAAAGALHDLHQSANTWIGLGFAVTAFLVALLITPTQHSRALKRIS